MLRDPNTISSHKISTRQPTCRGDGTRLFLDIPAAREAIFVAFDVARVSQWRRRRMNTLSLRDAIDLIRPNAEEAVAIAQQLLRASLHSDVAPTSEKPSLDTVLIAADGSAVCAPGSSAADIAGIGALLQAMLPATGGPRVSGSLRYTIARAIGATPAPPFESCAALAAALARHQPRDPSALVSALHGRAAAAAPKSAVDDVERRCIGRTAVELRRHLRHADEERYSLAHRLSQATDRIVPAPSAAVRSSATARWIAGGAAAIVMAFTAGYAAVALFSRTAASVPAAATIATGSNPLRTVRVAPFWTQTIRGPVVSGVELDRAHEGALERAMPWSVGTAFSPSFTSNGTALFFHTGGRTSARSALEEVDLGAGDLRLLTIQDDGAKNYHVRPSPDDSRMAFDSDRDGERGVYIANFDGTDAHRVSGPGFAALPSWSPDGRTLAFVRGAPERPRVWNLWLLDVASGAMRRVTAFRYGQTWSASWFPDGHRICYSHEEQLFIHDLDTGDTREFASPISRRLVRTPAVSPDGRHVIFQVSGSGAWLMDAATGAMRFVLTDPTAEEFAWAPDGRRVAFHSARDGGWGIWLMSTAADQ